VDGSPGIKHVASPGVDALIGFKVEYPEGFP
jgi:hypothetical protein